VASQCGRYARRHAQQLPAACQFLFAVTVSQEAVASDALETIGQYVQQKAADEFLRVQRHGFLLAVTAIILVAERDLAAIDVQQAIVGEGYAVGVAAAYSNTGSGPAKGRLA
jgi:hypothetical protein